MTSTESSTRRTAANAGMADLVADAVRGEQRAWRDIVNRYQDALLRAARAWPLDDAAAHDVVQQTWMMACANLAGLREPEALGGWLHTVLRHECARLSRRRGREVPADEIGTGGAGRVMLAAEPALPESEAIRNDERRAVRAALRRLRPRDRDLLALTVEQGDLGYSEVGRRLGMPVGSIGPTRGRSLTRLRGELDALGVTGT